MKRLALSIIAGAFGTLMLLPTPPVHAESIRQDRREMREYMNRGDYRAAAREHAEIVAKKRYYYATREPYSYYYVPYGYGNREYTYNYYRHHHHHHYGWDRDDD